MYIVIMTERETVERKQLNLKCIVDSLGSRIKGVYCQVIPFSRAFSLGYHCKLCLTTRPLFANMQHSKYQLYYVIVSESDTNAVSFVDCVMNLTTTVIQTDMTWGK